MYVELGVYQCVWSWAVFCRHEMVGIVTEVGSKVTRFKVGDHVGVGCLVDSCGTCEACSNLQQQYCPRVVATTMAKPHSVAIPHSWLCTRSE